MAYFTDQRRTWNTAFYRIYKVLYGLGFVTIFYYLGRLQKRFMGYQLSSLSRLTLVGSLIGLYAFSPSYLSFTDAEVEKKITDQYFDSVQSLSELDDLIKVASNNEQISDFLINVFYQRKNFSNYYSP